MIRPRLITAVLLVAATGLADGATVRLRGLTNIDETEVLDALSGRLAYVKARPASPSRADDAAFLLEGLLARRGFTDPSVEWSIPDADTIVLTVREGPRSTLGNVEVTGVDEELAAEIASQVRSAFGSPARAGRRLQRDQDATAVPYSAARLGAGLGRARTLLHSRGFWAAEVAIVPGARRPSGATDLAVSVTTGPLHHLLVPRLEVDGPEPEELREDLLKFNGRPATTENLNGARNAVARHYRRGGYQFAEVDLTVAHEAGRTMPTLTVSPGERYRVGAVSIEGAEEVPVDRIARRFEEFPGHPYNAERAESKIRDLLDTGAFSSLRLEESPRPGEDIVDLTLHIREGKPDGYHAYAGLGSYEGPFIGGGYYHRNAFHRLWNFSAGLEVSALGMLGEVTLTDPWFLESDVSFTTRGFILARKYEGYDKLETGAGVQWSWDATRRYNLTAHLTSSYVSLSSDGIPSAELGPTNYLLTVAGIRQRYDRRNDKVLPTNGWFAQLDADLGLTAGDDSVSFLRSVAQLSIYQPVIGETSHMALGLRGGVIVPSGGTTELPIDLRFFNGGANSVRSFRERDLGPRASNGDPSGGEAYWIANLEYIHTLTGILRGVVFADAGTLNPDHGELFSSPVNYAAGLGIRLDLPIGPVRLEYGHNLSPDEGGPSGTWHFTIGTTF